MCHWSDTSLPAYRNQVQLCTIFNFPALSARPANAIHTSMCMNYPLLFLSLSLCLRCAIFHGMAGMYILQVGQFSSLSGLNQGPFFHYFVFFAKFALILALSVTFNWHIMQGHKQSIKCKKLHENAKIRNFCTYLGSISAPLQTIAAYLCVHLSRL